MEPIHSSVNPGSPFGFQVLKAFRREAGRPPRGLRPEWEWGLGWSREQGREQCRGDERLSPESFPDQPFQTPLPDPAPDWG